eukprot:PITA_02720
MSSFLPDLSKDTRQWIRHQYQPYCIVGDILYRLGTDSFLCRCLTLEEAEQVLNDCHSGAYGGHMSGYATAKKILHAGYFWPSIFKGCILAICSCHECQIYHQKMHAPPTPLHLVVTVRPFAKWGIDYMTYNPRSSRGHGVPQAIVIDHDKHFRYHMMTELTTQLGLRHDSSTPYYPQANGHVEVVKKVLVTMLQCTIGMHKSNWHLMLFSALWAYRTSVKDATGFTPFQLVYCLEATLPIECEIPSLKLAVKLLPNTTTVEERLVYLQRLDKTH